MFWINIAHVFFAPQNTNPTKSYKNCEIKQNTFRKSIESRYCLLYRLDEHLNIIQIHFILLNRRRYQWYSCNTIFNYSQTISFKTQSILQRNGEFVVENNNAFCNILLLILLHIQVYCTFLGASLQKGINRIFNPNKFKCDTVEPRYNEDLGTMKITFLFQVSCYIKVKTTTKSWTSNITLL